MSRIGWIGIASLVAKGAGRRAEAGQRWRGPARNRLARLCTARAVKVGLVAAATARIGRLDCPGSARKAATVVDGPARIGRLVDAGMAALGSARRGGPGNAWQQRPGEARLCGDWRGAEVDGTAAMEGRRRAAQGAGRVDRQRRTGPARLLVGRQGADAQARRRASRQEVLGSGWRGAVTPDEAAWASRLVGRQGPIGRGFARLEWAAEAANAVASRGGARLSRARSGAACRRGEQGMLGRARGDVERLAG